MLKNVLDNGILNIYTDGGCHNEGGDLKGIGAWAFVVQDENSDKVEVYAQRVTDTTNNRTEMMAVINAISFCEAGSAVNIISDSGYVVKGYTDPDRLMWIYCCLEIIILIVTNLQYLTNLCMKGIS
jgi:ribonuclease HI